MISTRVPEKSDESAHDSSVIVGCRHDIISGVADSALWLCEVEVTYYRKRIGRGPRGAATPINISTSVVRPIGKCYIRLDSDHHHDFRN
jgi:hypothetical protein